MKTLCLVFRKPFREFFSIEKVFTDIKPGLENSYSVHEVSVPNSRLTPFNFFQNLLFGSKQKADLYHVTGDVHYMVFAFPLSKTVLTIHDCVFLYKSTGIKRSILKLLFLKWPVKYCKVVTTISENTKKDIVRFSGCRPEKVIVISNPLPKNFYFKEQQFREKNPVILFVGVTANKNLPAVIEAIKNIPCTLHIVGKIPLKEETFLKDLAISYKNSFLLSEQDLAHAYSDADIVLFPSLFEGFGLPILEGQLSGRPVITSNIDPMKDVAGEGACLVDPHSIESIRDGILKVIKNENYRNELVQKGFANTKRFDIAATVEKYLAVYRSVLKGVN